MRKINICQDCGKIKFCTIVYIKTNLDAIKYSLCLCEDCEKKNDNERQPYSWKEGDK